MTETVYKIRPELAGPAPKTIAFSHVFDIHYTLNAPMDFGVIPTGRRILGSTNGGIFSGPDIQGEILPGGKDWTLTGTDGVTQIDVHVMMRTDDDALIHGTWTGRMHAPPATQRMIFTPDQRAGIDHDKVYFRTAPTFETASEKYAWLNRSQFVASAQYTREGLSYRVLRVD